MINDMAWQDHGGKMIQKLLNHLAKIFLSRASFFLFGCGLTMLRTKQLKALKIDIVKLIVLPFSLRFPFRCKLAFAL
jgi:hypothetical protein